MAPYGIPTGGARLRVAVVTETYPPEVNGVAMTLGRMVGGLVARGHAVFLVRPRPALPDDRLAAAGPDEMWVAGVPIPRYPELRFGLVRSARLAARWRAWRPDVVHVATEGPLGRAALRAARRLGLPVVSDFHTNFHAYTEHYGVAWLRRPVETWLRRLHNASDMTLVPTRELQRDLGYRGYRKLQVVSRGVDTGLFQPARRSATLRAAWGAGEDALVVAHVGRLAAEKNLPLVLRAFEAIAAVRPGARLVFVGDGPLRAGLERAHPGHVFAGMRHGTDLAAHYASADLFLFPSLTETFGNVVLEALASGLAVVAFDRAGAAELVTGDHNGVLARCGDDADFVAAAVHAARDPLRLVAMRFHARASVRGRDWEEVHDAFAACLCEAVRRYRSRRDAEAHFFLALR